MLHVANIWPGSFILSSIYFRMCVLWMLSTLISWPQHNLNFSCFKPLPHLLSITIVQSFMQSVTETMELLNKPKGTEKQWKFLISFFCGNPNAQPIYFTVAALVMKSNPVRKKKLQPYKVWAQSHKIKLLWKHNFYFDLTLVFSDLQNKSRSLKVVWVGKVQ